MSTELVACEFEDSTNCIWNAQEQGNGIGQSFVDIDGEVTYIKEPPFECPPNKVPGWLDENGMPQGCVDNNPNPSNPKEDMVVPEVPAIEVPAELEAVEVVPVAPEAIETGVTELAETGTAEVITGVLLGIALVVAGVFTMMKGRRVA